jgi:hypothetical protein
MQKKPNKQTNKKMRKQKHKTTPTNQKKKEKESQIIHPNQSHQDALATSAVQHPRLA